MNIMNRLIGSTILFLIIITAWPVTAALTIPTGTTEEQIKIIAENLSLHIINFSLALLIAPSLLWMLYLLSQSLRVNLKKRRVYAVIFCYTAYLILITVSYGSQITILPFLLQKADEQGILRWFFYNDNSLVILINQGAYFLWSTATILLFGSLFNTKERLLKGIVFILLSSSLLQISASIGLVLQASALTKLSFISGMLLLPAGLLILIRSILSLNK